MPRFVLTIEYDGHAYHGWQRQSDRISIQHCLEQALSKVANQTVSTVCAGRTDAGVHAVGQVVHFDVLIPRQPNAWVFGVNSFLPNDIRVLTVSERDPSFDARRSALFRRYCYIIYNNKIRPSIFRNQVSWYHYKLDAALMQQAAQFWVGEHDFSSFRDSDCQSVSPIRLVKNVNVYRIGDLIIFDIIANAFLHHMVRNMVGVLLEIGSQKRYYQWANEVLQAKNRALAGVTALPYGLYLIGVEYPKEFAISTIDSVPWFFQQLLHVEK